MIVRRNGNRFSDVAFSAMFGETLGVVMWMVVFFVIRLAVSFLNAPLSRQQGCKNSDVYMAKAQLEQVRNCTVPGT